MPLWVYILLAILFGWLILPQIAKYTGFKVG